MRQPDFPSMMRSPHDRGTSRIGRTSYKVFTIPEIRDPTRLKAGGLCANPHKFEINNLIKPSAESGNAITATGASKPGR